MKRAITKTETEITIRLRVPSSTIENKKLNEMKTKNNVQKTILRSVAVVVSFVLISFTVSAQDFWKKLLTNSSFNEIAMAMTETSKKPATTNNSKANASSSFILNKENDKTLPMEDWMTNESYFHTSYNFLKSYPENNSEVENWMLNENLFEVNDEVEDQLKLEDWMISDKVWKI